MNRVAASILLAGVSVIACKKHDDAQVRPEPTQTETQTPVASTDTSAVGANAPSVSANVVASAVASVAPTSSAAPASTVQFGMNNGLGNDPNAPTAPWGREDLGGERGNMWGDAFGSGTGGLGSSTTDGGRLTGSRSTHTPKVRQGQTTVMGRLPPEVIQRIVRQNFGRFRLCYEQGLLKDPKLAGIVATKFVIDTQGAVGSVARDNSTTMPDASMVSCITRAFSSLSFPQPEGGIVVVVYPVIFEPGDP